MLDVTFTIIFSVVLYSYLLISFLFDYIDILRKYVINSYICFGMSYENEKRHSEALREAVSSDEDQKYPRIANLKACMYLQKI